MPASCNNQSLSNSQSSKLSTQASLTPLSTIHVGALPFSLAESLLVNQCEKNLENLQEKHKNNKFDEYVRKPNQIPAHAVANAA